MPRRSCWAVDRKLYAALLLVVSWGGMAAAQQFPPTDLTDADIANVANDLQLEVIVNEKPVGWIAAFRNEGGRLTIEAVQLENCGIRAAPEARLADDRIDISKLPGVSFTYDETQQSIAFTVPPTARAVHRIEGSAASSVTERMKPDSHHGAVVNYTLYGASGGAELRDMWDFQGLSGEFDTRVFGSLGLFSSSQIVTISPNSAYSTVRLNTSWSYSDPESMVTYEAGDILSAGLSWTRPVRMGGIQFQRNFALRSDLVTMPLPKVSGTAAVPSTVELYIDNTRRSSHEVPAGPFSISDIPTVTGNATASLVVRDALGRETVTNTSLIASSKLLTPGFLDYSAEIGAARRNYGVNSFDYDERPFAIGSARVGVTDRFTLEGHAEGGIGFLNAGAGGVFTLSRFGTGNAAIAASRYEGETGLLVAMGVDTEILGMNLQVNSQRTFGDYNDVASVTAIEQKGLRAARSGPPKVLDQVNLSVPLRFDETTLNFSLTNITSARDETSRIVGVTASRSIGDHGNLFVTAYTDLANDKSFGAFAGFTWSFSNNTTASTGVAYDRDGYAVTTDVSGSINRADGDIDWRVSDTEGSQSRRAAALAYRRSTGRIEGNIEQSDNSIALRGQVDGSIVAAGGDVFLTDRVEDAFAVVDAGAPHVAVEAENRVVGKTNRRGKLLVPNLRSYEKNRLAIDPDGLPLDTMLESTQETVMPHKGSGVVVKFGVKSHTGAKLVTLVMPDGTVVESGSLVSVEGSDASFIVGYDGQAYLTGLSGSVGMTVQQPQAGSCYATINLETVTTSQKTICKEIQ